MWRPVEVEIRFVTSNPRRAARLRYSNFGAVGAADEHEEVDKGVDAIDSLAYARSLMHERTTKKE